MGKYYMSHLGCSTTDSRYMSSITYNVLDWSKSHETGCVWLARRPGKDAGESANGGDVIFPYSDGS